MSDKQPVVGIVMGSDSDWPTMEAAAKALEESVLAMRPGWFQLTVCRWK